MTTVPESVVLDVVQRSLHMDPSVSEGEEDFMSGTYRCRDDIRLVDELF